MKVKKVSAVLALVLGARFLAFGAEAKTSGLIFSHYEYVVGNFLSNGTKAEKRNAFDISRLYLNASSKFDESFDGFVQFEANLLSRDNTANQVFLKQAWVGWKDIYPNATLRFGLVPTPWRSFEEGIWKHRFVAKILEDEEGLLNATDRGVSVAGRIPYVAYDLMMSNGEGTGARGSAGNEVNQYKDYAGRIAIAPFKEGPLSGFKINGQIHKGVKIANWPRDRAISGLSYESSNLNLWGAYYTSRDGSGVATGTDTIKGTGFSLHGVVTLPAGFWLFARFDQWDPNTNTADDARIRTYLGFGKKLTDGVRVALDHQFLRHEQTTATRQNQNILFTHLEVKF